MKVIKPQRVGLLTRPFEVRRELRLGVSVLLFVPLGSDRSLLSEVALWRLAAEEMGDAPVLDVGIPKSRCEYLVAGAAYPVLAEGHRQCAVRATVAGQQKTLLVAGDRHFSEGVISAPERFAKLPLEWRYAFGGPGFAPNPAGRGLAAENVDGEHVRRLPNIEYPNDPMRTPSSRPRPAGFRALDVTTPERAQKAGTHDARWLREDFPGFARDIDWAFFNVAPGDQQFERDSFELDAAYEFRNMHPTRGVIEGRLPNVRARCFVSRCGTAPEHLEEVPLRLGTLWFFPGRERAVLVFHGAATVVEDDASDITHLVAAAEDGASERRALPYYAAVLKRRLDPETGYLEGLKDSPLCPTELSPPDPAEVQLEAEFTGEDLIEKRQAKRRDREIAERRAEVASHGLDPDVHGPIAHPAEPVPSLEELPAFVEKAVAEAERMQREHAEDAERRQRENEALFARLGLDYGVVREELAPKPGGPPELTAARRAADLQKQIEVYAAQGLPTDHIQEILDDPEQQRMWRFAEDQGLAAYRISAHLQVPALARSADASAQVRAALGEARSQDSAGADYTGVDLSGLDLSGVLLEGALLESARLVGTNLRGAKLAGAVLAHADLQGADPQGADLRGANLGGARLDGANLSEGELEDAILANAHLAGARLDAAHLTRTDLSGATFKETRFVRARATETTFMNNALRGVDFSGARLERCNFLEVELSEARFCEADLSGSVLLGCTVGAADFAGARLVNLRAVEGTVFDGASFSGADLSLANLRGISLKRARFERATLDGADLSGANLEGANLYRAVARGARFGRANLSRARLVGANLMEASLASARLDGADLTGAHLFGADLSRIHLDLGTVLEPTSLLHARLHPMRIGGRSPLPDSEPT